MEIDKAIQNLCKGKTVIVVAHRLSALKMCERVAVVENHTITCVGTHEEVRNINVNIKMYIFDHLRMYIFAILPLDRYIFLSDKIFL